MVALAHRRGGCQARGYRSTQSTRGERRGSVQQLRGGVRGAPLGGARAVQHRRRRLRQARARQAGDDPRGLRGHGPRGALGRAAGGVEPLRARAARARRGQGRSRGDAPPTDAGDGCGVLRHVQVRRDPVVDVDPLRRRGDPAPRLGLGRQGPADQRRERGPHRPVAGRARAADRGPAGGRRRHVHARGHPRRRPRAALLLLRHDRAGEGHPARAPLPARARGVRLLPRRARRRAVPRHGGVGVGGGDRAAVRALAARRRPARLPARGRLRRAPPARRALPPRRVERLHDADRDAIDDVDRRRGHPLPAAVPHRVQRGRAARPRGDPLVPRAVRHHRARLLRAHRVLSARRQLPVPGRARGVDGQVDARLGRADPRRGRAARRDRRARGDLPAARAPTRTTRSATGTTRRRRRRHSAGSGSTPRTRRGATRRATSGTRAGPTT